MSLATAIGGGHLIFLAGIDATANKARRDIYSKIVSYFVIHRLNQSFSSFCCAGCLCCRGGPFTVLSDGSFLLDARRRNLPLLVCCQGLQHRGQHAGISSDFLG